MARTIVQKLAAPSLLAGVVSCSALPSFILCSAFVPACSVAPQRTEQQRAFDTYVALRYTYTATMKTLTALRVAGEIDDDTALKIEAIRLQADTTLTALGEAILAEDDEARITILINTVNESLRTLATYTQE